MRIEIRGVCATWPCRYRQQFVPCTTRCAAICKWRRRKEKEGRCEGYKQGEVCVCVRAGGLNGGEPSLCASKQQQHQHHRQLKAAAAPQGEGLPRRCGCVFWNDPWARAGGTQKQRLRGHWGPAPPETTAGLDPILSRVEKLQMLRSQAVAADEERSAGIAAIGTHRRRPGTTLAKNGHAALRSPQETPHPGW